MKGFRMWVQIIHIWDCLVLVLQRLGVAVAGVYRQLYRRCSEPLEHMAPVDRAAWARVRETVHTRRSTSSLDAPL
jgi:hypothetical protein